MCSLYFCDIVHRYPYHTSGKNIQILGKLNFKIFSDLCYNGYVRNIAFWLTVAYIVINTFVLIWGDKKINSLKYKVFLLENPEYNPDAKDGDKDGLVQEGTIYERKA